MAGLAMTKIENRRNLQVTFTKRRKGLVKKAYELSILCDIDIALITYSPSGRPFLFSGKNKIEDVIERYINHLQDTNSKEVRSLHVHECSSSAGRKNLIEKKKYTFSVQRLSRIMKSLKRENTSNDDASSSKHKSLTADSSDAKELKQEIGRMQHLLEAAKEQLRMYAGGPVEKASTVDMSSCERDLLDILTRVRLRKEYLLNNFLSSYDISTINILTSIGNEFESQFPDYAKAIDASAASNPLLDILQTEFDPSKMYYVPPDMSQESIPFTFQVRIWESKMSRLRSWP